MAGRRTQQRTPRRFRVQAVIDELRREHALIVSRMFVSDTSDALRLLDRPKGSTSQRAWTRPQVDQLIAAVRLRKQHKWTPAHLSYFRATGGRLPQNVQDQIEAMATVYGRDATFDELFAPHQNDPEAAAA